MIKEITAAEAGRQAAYDMWTQSMLPMVSVTVTFDITHLLQVSKDRGFRVNALLCYCIGRAANQIKEFHTLVLDKKFYWSDRIAVRPVLKDKNGALRTCDLEIEDSLEEFIKKYDVLTKEVWEKCESYSVDEAISIGTSCLSTSLVIDSMTNQYCEKMPNVYLGWGAYREEAQHKKTLSVSMHFHHVQMDGDVACAFMELVQEEMCQLGRVRMTQL